MKKKYLTFGFLGLAFLGRGQNTDTVFNKRIVPKTQIEAVFSSYNQDGNNSAITGGIGTEALVVIAPNIKITHRFKKYNTIIYDGGADFITSASSDNIDHIPSSASLHDIRSYSNLGYRRDFKKIDLGISGGMGFSLESAYFSIPASLALDYTEKSKMRSYQLTFQAFFDDLRWGRLAIDEFRPVKLIYPDELRYKNWFSIYTRNSYNIKFAFTQVLGKRVSAAFFPELIYQKGLLCTPYHRVYFVDGSERVENLPMQRIKVPLAIRLHYFAGSRTILKLQYSFYEDNWGITGNAIEAECAVKATPVITVSPFFRFYAQKGTRYFKPYKEHTISESYYTSDYDLSTMQTYKAGLGLRYAPFHYYGKRFQFEEVSLRYAFYYQRNGLCGNMLTLAVTVAAYGKER